MSMDNRRGPTQPNSNQKGRPPGGIRFSVLWVVLLIALIVGNIVVAPLLQGSGGGHTSISYSDFRSFVSKDTVASIVNQGDMITGTFYTGQQVTNTDGKPVRTTDFSTRLPTYIDTSLAGLLSSHHVNVSAKSPDGTSPLLGFLFSFGPVLLLIGGFIWLSRRASNQQQGIFGFGRSRARLYDKEQPRITFADVAGVEESKDELVEIVDFLKNPAKYQRLGGTIPKGVLLIGPPGTGKTLLAKAVAGEANVPFYNMSASEFVEMLVGVGASRVRDLFSQAKANAPSIIFVDELDAVGRQRGAGLGGGNDEREQTLNQLLTEMDGFDTRQAVIVLAATNRPDVLDAALLRPGRFDRRVTVQRPDRAGREAILRVHTRNVPLSPDVDLTDIASITPGLVGAELRNLVNEAALLAARKNRDSVMRVDFNDSMEKIILGVERRIMLSIEDRRRVAYHEGGHALLGVLIPGSDPVRRVTIVPRGQALGVTYQMPLDDRHNYPEDYLRSRIIGALGGRAAEEIVFGVVTSGAENDLKQVTEISRQMVTKWGMSHTLGLVAYGGSDDEVFLGRELATQRNYSDDTAGKIDEEIKRIVDDCYNQAVTTLRTHIKQLDVLAEALLEHESLDENEILKIVGVESTRIPEAPLEPTPIAGATVTGQ
ncbi:MAG: ATP-dependent metallopeptidase FtsH/Yme1/Tma family protein [Chloroflexi bacterium]|nr:ATP-dependent metallopeptidase FtsH/Yme1/Tma family protein [Chloroflexota bacterium]MDB5076641.1 ATP-dependent metallopeptidase FtsH/Yme1/Tma family protein [Chloroflexota bacterium]